MMGDSVNSKKIREMAVLWVLKFVLVIDKVIGFHVVLIDEADVSSPKVVTS